MNESKDINVNLLVSMLMQLDETLKQSVEGQSQSLKSVASALNILNEANEQGGKDAIALAVQITAENKAKFDELKAQIISTADSLTEDYGRKIEETEKKFSDTMTKEYVAKSEFGEYQETVASQFEKTTSEIGLSVSNTESVKTDLAEYKKENSSQLQIFQDEINSQVSDLYVTKSEYEEIKESVSSQVSQTASNITDSFKKEIQVISRDLEDTSNTSNKFIEEINAYIRRGELEAGVFGIEIGRSDSNIKTRFTNEKLSFYQGSAEVAYISGSNLYITRAEILDYLRLGNAEDGYFTLDVSSNGLEVRWDG